MELWPERQGRYCYYSKFGTVPGRSCKHNFHEQHQAPRPVYYDEELQQNPSKECSHWTVPGSRAGAALHEYTTCTERKMAFPSISPSFHFPFTLDHHPYHHQDVGGGQGHEVPEWTATQRAMRDHDKGFLREECERKWNPSNKVPCNKDTFEKRSESSYRELEAWATRYRHSLPRRRRIEAELRGSTQRTEDSSRADHRGAIMQYSQKYVDNREFGPYPPKAPTPNINQIMGMKEHTGYRRMFSQPPGYAAPPPYNSQHKVSTISHYCPSNWERNTKRPISGSCSQFSLRLNDGPADNRIGDKEGFKISDESQSNTMHEGLKAQREDANTLSTGSPTSILNTQKRQEHTLPQQYSSEKPKSRVIEGRKFKLEKKTGGLTIFCLVSRIAVNTENTSLLLSQTNPKAAETGYVSEEINPTLKLADEVDFTASTLTRQTKVANVRNLWDKQETPTPPNKKQEVDVFSSKACAHNDAEFNIKDECKQPLSSKYPLWREPRSIKRQASDGEENVCVHEVSHPVDIEVRRLDIKEESDDKKGLLVIDTTSVLVKMERIQPPNRDHVHFLGSPKSDHDILLENQYDESKSQAILMETTGQEPQKSKSRTKLSSETEINLTSPEQKHKKEEEPRLSSPESESETFEERAERILGIPLDHCAKKLDPIVLIEVTDLNAVEDETDTSDQIVTEVEHSQGHPQVVQTNSTSRLTEMSSNNGENIVSRSNGIAMPLTHMEMTNHSMIKLLCETIDLKKNEERNLTEEHQISQLGDASNMDVLSEYNLRLTAGISSTEICEDTALLVTDESFLLTQKPSSSSYLLDSMSKPAEALYDTNTQDEELITDSAAINKTDQLFLMQHLNDCQPDDAVNDPNETQSEDDGEPRKDLKEQFGTAEEEPFTAITLEQLLESINMDSTDDDPKTSDTIDQQSPSKGFEGTLVIMSHCTEFNKEEIKSEIEAKKCEMEAVNEKFFVEPKGKQNKGSQETQQEHFTCHRDSTQPQNSAICGEGDTECSFDLSTSDCVKPQPALEESPFPELPSQSEFLSFMNSAPASSPTPGSAIDVPKDPPLLCVGSCEDLSQFLVLDQLFCTTSPNKENAGIDDAHEVLLQHPQSLWDVVSRIRKHTAPDSENEEEEVTEPWDSESVGPALVFTNVLMDWNEHVEEDRLSCSSISSHGSGDTVIVTKAGENRK